MKIRNLIIASAISTLAISSCSKQPRLDLSLSDRFEGQTVELVNFLDSTALDTAVVTGGKATFTLPEGKPVFAAVLIDGRTRAFYITEPGEATANDSTGAATGTPLNDRFAVMLSTLDSIENLDDMPAYMEFVQKAYNESKGTPLASYFGMEWIKYADLPQVDSILADAPADLRESPKTAYYHNFARLRDNTAPGKTYVDFEGEDADGKTIPFSALIEPGTYTLVDFWASWCPYCIKEIPQLKALKEKMAGKNLRIVGVAVRDVPDNSKAAIKKHGIDWPVLFNTQRRPYDIYGFSGIPHHMLIGPDGTIISRGETADQIEERLNNLPQ